MPKEQPDDLMDNCLLKLIFFPFLYYRYGFGEQEDDIVEMGAANGLPDSDSDTDQDLTLKEYDSSESL